MARNQLREGFTTGTAVAAAAKAALILLLKGKSVPNIDVPLPLEGRMVIPLAGVAFQGEGAEALVIKDGGDDPDVTHRAGIRAVVGRIHARGPSRVVIRGGTGVGRVTRPGLPVPVGEAAINPAPRRQIEAAIREVLDETGAGGEIVVTVEVDDGERIALKTLNPRLGILGGISILGTRGTVKPFSNKAYKDTITMSLDVARAQGPASVALATGGKSERLLREIRPDLPDPAWIQVGDFFAFSLKEASMRGFESILYACFFGKLIKMGQGHPYTHARKSRIDFTVLSSWCASAGLGQKGVKAVSTANTSREALEIIRKDKAAPLLLEYALIRAADTARRVVEPGIELVFYLFHFDETLLATRRDGPLREGDTPHEP
ncbi:MAG: cobalt-precorrin-5B (C(1))-methyltransferase [Thermodesulfobacteriota bacterium]